MYEGVKNLNCSYPIESFSQTSHVVSELTLHKTRFATVNSSSEVYFIARLSCLCYCTANSLQKTLLTVIAYSVLEFIQLKSLSCELCYIVG